MIAGESSADPGFAASALDVHDDFQAKVVGSRKANFYASRDALALSALVRSTDQ